MDKIYSHKDAERLRVILAYLSGEYTRKIAARNLNVTERQMSKNITNLDQKALSMVIRAKDQPVNIQMNYGLILYLYIPESMVKTKLSLTFVISKIT